MRIAAIDVGTNSVHLLVADVTPTGDVVFVEKAREQVELGRGGLDNSQLAPDAMQRGFEAMSSFQLAIEGLGVDEVTAAATSAVREAKNGSDWVREVRDRTGIHVRIISGTDEARLIYLGARKDLDFSKGYALLLDLGGGSAEIILCDSSQALVKRSLPLGHIRLAERFGRHDPPSADDWAELRAHCRNTLTPLLSDIPPGQFGTVTGTSGAARTLARMATMARGEEAPTHDHGLILRKSDLKKLINLFRTLPSSEYTSIPGMDARRERTLPFAAAMIYEMMKAFGASELVASERSLRDGLIVDWALTHQPELSLSRTVAWPRMRAVLRMMDRFQVDREHAEHVRDLALSLFDALQGLHQLPVSARRMLEFGSLLHDIGHHIAGESHNIHGQYLIAHSRLQGFTAPDVAILGNLVRYHRGGKPKKEHSSFASLGRSQQRMVTWLAGILRLVDGLDRSHEQPVTHIETQLKGDTIVIVASSPHTPHLERWAADRRKGLLERASNKDVSVRFNETPPNERA